MATHSDDGAPPPILLGGGGGAGGSGSQLKLEECLCDICGKVYANGTYMRKHRKQVHLAINEDHQQCPKCPLKFKSLKGFWRHIICIHESDVVERTETTRLPRELQVQEDEVLVEAGETKCLVCGKAFSSTSGLIRHMNNTHLHPDADSAIKCVRCGKRFMKEETLEEHITEVHERNVSDLFAFPCYLCQLPFSSVDGLWRHKTKVHDLGFKIEIGPISVRCQYCDELVYTDYSAHVMEFHSEAKAPPPCEQCGKKFSDLKTLKRHLSTVHSTERAFPCQVCGKAFKDANSVQAHQYVHKSIALEPNLKAMLKNVFGTVCSKTFTCGLCQLVVNSSLEARIHLYIKHPESFKEFMKEAPTGIPCPCCSESFETKDLVIPHVETMHPEHQIPTCHLCEHKELTERYLNFHYKEYHPEECRHFCKICNTSFSNGRLLRLHVKREHGEESRQCPYCPEKHIKVKLHVTIKHPDKADEYGQLVKDAIRDEVEARMKFNEFLDPGCSRNARNRKKRIRDDDDTTDDEEELLIDYNIKPIPPVQKRTVPVALSNYKIETQSSRPHLIEVRRLEQKKEPELEENAWNATSELEDAPVLDVKPCIADLNPVDLVDENAFTSQTETLNLESLCRPMKVRIAKLTNSEIQKWTPSGGDKTNKTTSVEKVNLAPTPKHSKRKRRRRR